LQISWGVAPGFDGSRLWRLIRSAPSTAPSDTPRQKSPDARWLQYSLKLKRGRFRVGLGVGAGIRAWDALYRTPSNTATAYWPQKPTLAGRVRARTCLLTISKNHALVCIEDLQVRNMSKSARGDTENPGRNVRAKSDLNKAILDQGWGEFRRRLKDVACTARLTSLARTN